MPRQNRNWQSWAVEGAFLGWLALYVAVWVQPRLVYLAGHPVVGHGWLRQLDAFGWPGVVLRVVEVWLLGELAQRAGEALTGRAPVWLRWLPRVVYVLIAGRYDAARCLGWQTIGALAALSALARGGWGLRALVGLALVGWTRWPAPPHGIDPHLVTPLTFALELLLPLGLLAAFAAVRWAPAAPSCPLRWRAVVAVTALAVLHAVATQATFDTAGARRVARDQRVLDGRWREILRDAEADPRPSPLLVHDVDTALARLGQLPERMFCYPQAREALLLPLSGPFDFAYRFRLADQWLELGRVNNAEQALHNALSHTGDHPLLLRRLALVYLVKGDLPAARLYLRNLERDLVQGRWARAQLARLAADPQLRGDAEVQRLRAVQLSHDDLLEVSPSETGKERIQYLTNVALLHLLDEHPRNRHALDCLLALYLLIGRPDGVEPELPRLVAAGAKEIPTPWEEAILLAADRSRRAPDLCGLAIRDDTRRRYRAFQQIVRRQRGDLRAALPELSRQFAGTYLLYLAQMSVNQ